MSVAARRAAVPQHLGREKETKRDKRSSHEAGERRTAAAHTRTRVGGEGLPGVPARTARPAGGTERAERSPAAGTGTPTGAWRGPEELRLWGCSAGENERR